MAATAILTPRQTEVKKLLDSGKTPREVAEVLGISEAAVYQQRLRINKASGAAPKRRKRTTRKRTKAPPKSSTSTTAPRRAVGGDVTATASPIVTLRSMTPLQAIRGRLGEIEGQLKESSARVTDATKVLKTASEQHEKLVAKFATEQTQLAAAEDALTRTRPAKRTNGRRTQPQSVSPEQAQQAAREAEALAEQRPTDEALAAQANGVTAAENASAPEGFQQPDPFE